MENSIVITDVGDKSGHNVACKYCNTASNEKNLLELTSTRNENIHRPRPTSGYGNNTKKEPVSVTLLKCTLCQRDIAIRQNGNWCRIDDFVQLSDNTSGITRVSTDFEHKVLYLLAQVLYNQNDIDQSESSSSPFSLFSASEAAWLLWFEGCAVGFYTVKDRGTPVSCESWLTYDLPVLDTIYVHSEYRRRGLAIDMLQHFVERHQRGDLGISAPVSLELLKVVYKLLLHSSSLRDRLWECEGPGGEGDRRSLWIHARCVLNKRKRTASKNGDDK